MLERSTSHVGKGVALVAQVATPVCPSVYRRPTISDSRNDHSSFYATDSALLVVAGISHFGAKCGPAVPIHMTGAIILV
jgi:hypothetical protein